MGLAAALCCVKFAGDREISPRAAAILGAR